MNKKANKKSSGGSTNRAKPLTVKTGTTKSGKRRYGCGGKMKK